MAHLLPNMSALALQRNPSVPIGARKRKPATGDNQNAPPSKQSKSPTPDQVTGETRKGAPTDDDEDRRTRQKVEREELQEAVEKRLRELLDKHPRGEGEPPTENWKPTIDPKTKKPIDPNPDQNCCTGSRLIVE